MKTKYFLIALLPLVILLLGATYVDKYGSLSYFQGNGAGITNVPGTSIVGPITNNTTGNAATATLATTATTATTVARFAVVATGLATLQTGTNKVSTAFANATNIFQLTYYGLNGNLSTLGITNITAGSSFNILSGNASDTNQVFWQIVKP